MQPGPTGGRVLYDHNMQHDEQLTEIIEKTIVVIQLATHVKVKTEIH